MDTSNNPQEYQITEPQIDIIDYLFGSIDRRIPTTSLSLETWVKAIRRLIEESKPYLKYFWGFKEIMDQYSTPGFVYKARDKKSIIYPEGVTAKTRIMSITKSGDGLHAYWDQRKFIDKQLYMNDKGEILLFTTCSTYEQPFGAGNRNSVEHSCEITVVDDLEFADLIWKSHGRITDLLECLQEVLIKGIEERQKRLDSLKGVLSIVDRWQDLIELKVLCKKCTGSKDRHESCPHCGNSSSE